MGEKVALTLARFGCCGARGGASERKLQMCLFRFQVLGGISAVFKAFRAARGAVGPKDREVRAEGPREDRVDRCRRDGRTGLGASRWFVEICSTGSSTKIVEVEV